MIRFNGVLKAVGMSLALSSAAWAASPFEVITNHVKPETFQQAIQILTGQLPLLPGTDAYVLDRWTKDGMTIARLYLHGTIRHIGFPDVNLQVFSDGPVVDNVFERTSTWVHFVFEIPGTEKPNEVVLIGANYDSDAPDASQDRDNATGAAGVLAIAEALKKSGVKPARTIRFVLWDAGAGMMTGPDDYLKQAILTEMKDKREKVGLVIDLDRVGYSDGQSKGGYFTYDPSVQKLLREYERVNGSSGLSRSPKVGFSPVHFSASLGIQSINFSGESSDSPSKLDLDHGLQIARNVAGLGYWAANTKEFWQVNTGYKVRRTVLRTLERSHYLFNRYVSMSDAQEQDRFIGAGLYDGLEARIRVEKERRVNEPSTRAENERLFGDWGRAFMNDRTQNAITNEERNQGEAGLKGKEDFRK